MMAFRLAICLIASVPLLAQDLEHAQGTNPGIFAFTGHCASCHDSGKDGAPDRYTLNRNTPEQVYAAITVGSMAMYAKDLGEYEKRVLAVYVGGRPFGSIEAGEASAMPNRCKGESSFNEAAAAGEWNGWGLDNGNSRFQASPGLTAEQVPHLTLKWAFGFPNGNSAYGQPAVVGGRVFVGADTGFVYSLDAESGCVYWSFRAHAGIRTAITIGPKKMAYFGDVKGNVYALHAETGALAWMERADTHPIARITGAPALAEGRLYVPVSSLEESGAGNPKYPCCTFRGSVVAYDALTGKRIWKAYTIPEEPKPLRKTSIGTQLWGPAGAGVWSKPAIDLKRHALYVGTGNGYTEPAAAGSDAVIAFDLGSGKMLWTKQVRSKDAYVRDCPGKYRPNVPVSNKSETCPDDLGPDMDFGNAPMLRALADGRTIIVIGQKSGDAWALDPDRRGEVVWNRMVGGGVDAGGGGMQWGSAADRTQAYFPLTRGGAGFGMGAVNLSTGELVWRANPPVAAASPSTVIPGVVFSGGTSGTFYAYSTTDGHALWQFDTVRSFETVNRVPAVGGGMSNGSGPVVAGGRLFLTSGNSELGFGRRGNVLLVFAPDLQ